MTDHPRTHPPDAEPDDLPQPRSDEADPEKTSTPAGVTRDLERTADEMGATTDPSKLPEPDPDSPGATIDCPEPAEPNEPA